MCELSSIMAMFFDFNDTLAVHNQRSKIANYYEKIWKNPDDVYDGRCDPNEGIRLFLEEFKGVPKYCITHSSNSLAGEVKQMWLNKYFPGEFKKTICTATPEEKVSVMQVYASIFELSNDKLLLVDDRCDTLEKSR